MPDVFEANKNGIIMNGFLFGNNFLAVYGMTTTTSKQAST